MFAMYLSTFILPSAVVLVSMATSRGMAVDKLASLRSLMSQHNLTAYIVPSTDDHSSEYLLEADSHRAYLSGFTGSYGTAAVTDKQALMWTDSRYFIQAEKQLDLTRWTLMKLGDKTVPKLHEWLGLNLQRGDRVGVDPKKISVIDFEKTSDFLGKKGIELVPLLPNLVEEIWTNRPPHPSNDIFVHDLKYAGESWEDKVQRLQKQLNGSAIVINVLDQIAWLTNLRGSDFPHTPVFRAFAILNRTNLTLYTSAKKVTQEVRRHIMSTRIHFVIEEYDSFWNDLVELGQDADSILLPSAKSGSTSYHIKNLLPKEKCKNGTSPIMEMKSCKNKVEAAGMRRAHIRDSVAICQLIYNMENDIESGSASWDEMKVVVELEKLRSEQDLNMGSSFPTISAFGINSALPHYMVTEESNLRIDAGAPLTIDSGGQYLDGTIDTTRVFRAGQPSQAEIQVYTALLKGVIDLTTSVFPEGTKMAQLDFVARRPLFQEGRDFGHGVTHGTGCFLGVHEDYNGTLFESFVGSQEPGYYRENHFGMRLENLVIVVPASVENFTKQKLLAFDQLTLVPYERKLIDLSKMDRRQIVWLNEYHKKVEELVGAEMKRQDRMDLYDWLVDKTQQLPL